MASTYTANGATPTGNVVSASIMADGEALTAANIHTGTKTALDWVQRIWTYVVGFAGYVWNWTGTHTFSGAVNLPADITAIAQPYTYTVGGGGGNPAFTAPYTSNPYRPLKFWKDAMGMVCFEGGFRNPNGGGTGGPVFTLPSGYRPAGGMLYAAVPLQVGGSALVLADSGLTIDNTTGVVSVQETGDYRDFYMDSIRFRAA